MGLRNIFYGDLNPEFTECDLDYLFQLLERSAYDYRQREHIKCLINTETDVSELERIKYDLLHNDLGIDGMTNYGQGDIATHLRRFL